MAKNKKQPAEPTLENGKQYTCPLCDSKLNVEEDFVETRCESCGMYVINVDQELEDHDITVKSKELTEKVTDILNECNELYKANKFTEAIQKTAVLLQKLPNHPAINLLFANCMLAKYQQLAYDEPTTIMDQHSKDLIEQSCERIKNVLPDFPDNKDLQEEYKKLIQLKNKLFTFSSFVYKAGSAEYNLDILEGRKSIAGANCVKIVEDEKRATENYYTRKDFRGLMEAPEPIPFPGKSGNKGITITFWIFTVLAGIFGLMLYGILFDQSIIASTGLAEYSYAEILTAVVGAFTVVIAWLSWIVYWIISKFKKVDDLEHKAFSIIRYILGVILVLSLMYLAVKIYAIVVCRLVNDPAKTGLNLNTEIHRLSGSIITTFVLLSILTMSRPIRAQKFCYFMNIKPPMFKALLRYLVIALEYIGLSALILFGIGTITHLINNDIVTVIFGGGANKIIQIVKYGLIISASLFVLGLVVDLIWTACENKANKKQVEANKELNKKAREKRAKNPKVVYKNDIPVKKKAIENLKGIIAKANEELEMAVKLVDDAFYDYKSPTYAEIDAEIYVALTGKQPPKQETEVSSQN